MSSATVDTLLAISLGREGAGEGNVAMWQVPGAGNVQNRSNFFQLIAQPQGAEGERM